MERIKFDYSLKNIPTPSKIWYQLRLIDKIESVIKRMHWKAHFFLTNTHNANDSVNRETWLQVETPPWPKKRIRDVRNRSL